MIRKKRALKLIVIFTLLFFTDSKKKKKSFTPIKRYLRNGTAYSFQNGGHQSLGDIVLDESLVHVGHSPYKYKSFGAPSTDDNLQHEIDHLAGNDRDQPVLGIGLQQHGFHRTKFSGGGIDYNEFSQPNEMMMHSNGQQDFYTDKVHMNDGGHLTTNDEMLGGRGARNRAQYAHARDTDTGDSPLPKKMHHGFGAEPGNDDSWMKDDDIQANAGNRGKAPVGMRMDGKEHWNNQPSLGKHTNKDENLGLHDIEENDNDLINGGLAALENLSHNNKVGELKDDKYDESHRLSHGRERERTEKADARHESVDSKQFHENMMIKGNIKPTGDNFADKTFNDILEADKKNTDFLDTKPLQEVNTETRDRWTYKTNGGHYEQENTGIHHKKSDGERIEENHLTVDAKTLQDINSKAKQKWGYKPSGDNYVDKELNYILGKNLNNDFRKEKEEANQLIASDKKINDLDRTLNDEIEADKKNTEYEKRLREINSKTKDKWGFIANGDHYELRNSDIHHRKSDGEIMEENHLTVDAKTLQDINSKAKQKWGYKASGDNYVDKELSYILGKNLNNDFKHEQLKEKEEASQFVVSDKKLNDIIGKNGDKLNFHDHDTDYISRELNKLENEEQKYGTKEQRERLNNRGQDENVTPSQHGGGHVQRTATEEDNGYDKNEPLLVNQILSRKPLTGQKEVNSINKEFDRLANEDNQQLGMLFNDNLYGGGRTHKYVDPEDRKRINAKQTNDLSRIPNDEIIEQLKELREKQQSDMPQNSIAHPPRGEDDHKYVDPEELKQINEKQAHQRPRNSNDEVSKVIKKIVEEDKKRPRISYDDDKDDKAKEKELQELQGKNKHLKNENSDLQDELKKLEEERRDKEIEEREKEKEEKAEKEKEEIEKEEREKEEREKEEEKEARKREEKEKEEREKEEEEKEEKEKEREKERKRGREKERKKEEKEKNEREENEEENKKKKKPNDDDDDVEKLIKGLEKDDKDDIKEAGKKRKEEEEKKPWWEKLEEKWNDEEKPKDKKPEEDDVHKLIKDLEDKDKEEPKKAIEEVNKPWEEKSDEKKKGKKPAKEEEDEEKEKEPEKWKEPEEWQEPEKEGKEKKEREKPEEREEPEKEKKEKKEREKSEEWEEPEKEKKERKEWEKPEEWEEPEKEKEEKQEWEKPERENKEKEEEHEEPENTEEPKEKKKKKHHRKERKKEEPEETEPEEEEEEEEEPEQENKPKKRKKHKKKKKEKEEEEEEEEEEKPERKEEEEEEEEEEKPRKKKKKRPDDEDENEKENKENEEEKKEKEKPEIEHGNAINCKEPLGKSNEMDLYIRKSCHTFQRIGKGMDDVVKIGTFQDTLVTSGAKTDTLVHDSLDKTNNAKDRMLPNIQGMTGQFDRSKIGKKGNIKAEKRRIESKKGKGFQYDLVKDSKGKLTNVKLNMKLNGDEDESNPFDMETNRIFGKSAKSSFKGNKNPYPSFYKDDPFNMRKYYNKDYNPYNMSGFYNSGYDPFNTSTWEKYKSPFNKTAFEKYSKQVEKYLKSRFNKAMKGSKVNLEKDESEPLVKNGKKESEKEVMKNKKGEKVGLAPAPKQAAKIKGVKSKEKTEKYIEGKQDDSIEAKQDDTASNLGEQNKFDAKQDGETLHTKAKNILGEDGDGASFLTEIKNNLEANQESPTTAIPQTMPYDTERDKSPVTQQANTENNLNGATFHPESIAIENKENENRPVTENLGSIEKVPTPETDVEYLSKQEAPTPNLSTSKRKDLSDARNEDLEKIGNRTNHAGTYFKPHELVLTHIVDNRPTAPISKIQDGLTNDDKPKQNCTEEDHSKKDDGEKNVLVILEEIQMKNENAITENSNKDEQPVIVMNGETSTSCQNHSKKVAKPVTNPGSLNDLESLMTFPKDDATNSCHNCELPSQPK